MNKAAVLLVSVSLTACAAPLPPAGDVLTPSSAVGRTIKSASSLSSVSSMPWSSASAAVSSQSAPRAESAMSSKVATSSFSSAALRVIHLSVSGGVFVPNAVNVRKGERVQLIVGNAGGMQGFAIPQLRIHEPVDATRRFIIDLPTDVPGVFEFRCTASCGVAEQSLRGTVEIVR